MALLISLVIRFYENQFWILQANPPVGKDQPPDLAALAPSGSIVLPDIPQTATSLRVAETHASAGSKSTVVAGKSFFLPQM